MRQQLAEIAATLERIVTALQPAGLSGPAAVAALDLFERLARLAEAGRLTVLPHIEQTRAWQGEGHPSAAHWAAARTGTTVGRAVEAINTAKALAKLPDTRAALTTGAISPHQTHEIALAANADPSSEQKLLTTATAKTTAELRNECRMVRTAAAGDEHQERIHQTRSVRSRLDSDGAHLLIMRNTSEAAAPLLAYLKADADRRANRARRDGIHEPYEAHLADALCAIPMQIGFSENTSRGAKPRAKDRAVRAVVYIHADLTAWQRGRAVPGERCQIVGAGPTTIAAARRLAAQPGGLLSTRHPQRRQPHRHREPRPLHPRAHQRRIERTRRQMHHQRLHTHTGPRTRPPRPHRRRRQDLIHKPRPPLRLPPLPKDPQGLADHRRTTQLPDDPARQKRPQAASLARLG